MSRSASVLLTVGLALLVACQDTASSGSRNESGRSAGDLSVAVSPLLGELGDNGASGAFLDPESGHQFSGNLRLRIEASHPEQIEQLYIAVDGVSTETVFTLCEGQCNFSSIDAWVSGLNPAELLLSGSETLELLLLVDDGNSIAEVDTLSVDWTPPGLTLTSAELNDAGDILVDWSADNELDYFNIRALSGEFASIGDLPDLAGEWQRLGVTGTSGALPLPESALATPVTVWIEGLNASGSAALSDPETVAFSNPDVDFSAPMALRAPAICWTPPSLLLANTDTEWALELTDPEEVVTLQHDAPANLGLSLDVGDRSATFSQPQPGSYTFTVTADNQRGTAETLGPFRVDVVTADTVDESIVEWFDQLTSVYEPPGGVGECQATRLSAYNEGVSYSFSGLVSSEGGLLAAVGTGEDWRVHRFLDGQRIDSGSERRGFYQAAGQSNNGTSLDHMMLGDEGRLFLMAVGSDSGAQILIRELDAETGEEIDEFQLESLTAFPGFDFQQFTRAGTFSPDGNVLYLGGLEMGDGVLMAVDISGSGPAVAEDFGGEGRSYSSEFPLARALHIGSDDELYLFTGEDAGLIEVYRVPTQGPGAGLPDPNYGDEGVWEIEAFPDSVLIDVARSANGDMVALLSGVEGSPPLTLVPLDPINQSVGGNALGGQVLELENRRFPGIGPTPGNMVFDDEGRLYVLAGVDEPGNPVATEVRRYTADGQPDLTWGDQGIAAVIDEAGESDPEAMVLHDDRIHLVMNELSTFSLYRLNDVGLPDSSDNQSARVQFGASVGDRARDMVVQGADPDGRSLVLNQIPGQLMFDVFDFSSTVWALTDQPGDLDMGFSGDGQLDVEFLGSSQADPVGLGLFVDEEFQIELLTGANSSSGEDWAVALHWADDGTSLDSMIDMLSFQELIGPDPDAGVVHAVTGAASRGFVMGWRTVGGNDEALVANYLAGISTADPDGFILGGDFPDIPGGLAIQSRALDGTVLLEEVDSDFVGNLITLVHYFQWDGDDQINHQTHLVRISEGSTAVNTAVLSDLDGELPLAVSQYRFTNDTDSPEDSLILVATLNPDSTIRVSAYEIDTTSGIEILPDAVWDTVIDGLQANDLNDIALSATLFSEPLTRHVYVGGSTAAGQPLLVALDPADGIEHQRWSGRDLGQMASGHVVAAQPVTPFYEQPDFFSEPITHLQVLIDAYVDGRWQSLVKRIPFVALRE